MNIGTRITERLDALNWQRRDLLDRVYGLSAQALSNLIRRGSKRSEWDEQIADALGVSVLWLVYGVEAHTAQHAKQDIEPYVLATISPKTKRQKRIDEISALFEQIDDTGLAIVLDKCRDIAQEYPVAIKQTPSS